MITHEINTLDLLLEGEFYIIRKPIHAHQYPIEIILDGKVYIKHMGIIYLPAPPEKLSLYQIVELGKLRARYFDKVVDRNYVKEIYSFTYKLISNNISTIQKRNGIKLLDYGTGTGTFIDCVRFSGIDGVYPIEFYGVDLIDYDKVKMNLYDSFSIISYDDMVLPYDGYYFDVEVALFVLHYNVPENHVSQLFDKLQNDGIFIFNLYRPSIEYRSYVITKIENAGFTWEMKIFESELVFNGAKHAPVEFYICRKQPV